MRAHRRSDTHDLKLVAAVLKSAELLDVCSVPPAQTKTCDLRASDEHDRYLVEVKGIHDNEDVVETLRTGRTHKRSQPVDYSDPLWKKVDGAVRQLHQTRGKEADTLLLVALIERSRLLPQGIVRRARDHLYGVRTVADLAETAHRSHDCLYFSESIFFRHRADLDGVILMDGTGIGMCLNDHSERAQRLQQSRLGRFFASLGLLHNVAKLEREAGYFVADCDVKRANEYAVLQYLKGKYGLKQPVALRSHEYTSMFLA